MTRALPDFAAELAALTPLDRLRAARARIPGRVVFTTSLGLEDQVLTHLIFSHDLDIEVVSLETGRLFPETLDLWQATEARYGRRIRAFLPDAADVEAFVAREGVNGFRNSVEARKACCHARKVRPLARALEGAALWITGLRADQSANRAGSGLFAFDAALGLPKLNPLLDWSRDDVATFAAEQAVPVNPLHRVGFLSIGCAPCTRAVAPGEPERAGRWWWEEEAGGECGLHVSADGRLVRANQAGSATP